MLDLDIELMKRQEKIIGIPLLKEVKPISAEDRQKTIIANSFTFIMMTRSCSENFQRHRRHCNCLHKVIHRGVGMLLPR